MMVHGARLIGPAIGGLLIQFVGPSLCFFLDGVSYIGVIAALAAMRVKPHVPRTDQRSVLQDLKEGLRYIWASAPIRAMLLLMGLVSVAGIPATSTLMPVFAEYFGGKSNSALMLGLLMGATGVGALSGAIYLASRKSIIGLGRVIAVTSGIFGVAIVGLALSNHVGLSVAIASVAGLGMFVCFASANTLIQTLTDDHMRGRVMSFFTMAFVGMAPWGALLAGVGAKALGGGVYGAARTLMIGGSLVMTAAAAFAFVLPALRRVVRPIYARKGILPEPLADGMQTAADVVSAPEH
jgi:MFS family permease